MKREHLDMLYRVALAEYFTSPSEPARYNRVAALDALVRGGLITLAPARLTEGGRRAVRDFIGPERLAVLDRMAARRAAARKGR